MASGAHESEAEDGVEGRVEGRVEGGVEGNEPKRWEMSATYDRQGGFCLTPLYSQVPGMEGRVCVLVQRLRTVDGLHENMDVGLDRATTPTM
jgi:hypothetical protein